VEGSEEFVGKKKSKEGHNIEEINGKSYYAEKDHGKKSDYRRKGLAPNPKKLRNKGRLV